MPALSASAKSLDPIQPDPDGQQSRQEKELHPERDHHLRLIDGSPSEVHDLDKIFYIGGLEANDYIKLRLGPDDARLLLTPNARTEELEKAEECLMDLYDYLMICCPKFAEMVVELLSYPPDVRPRSDLKTATSFAQYRSSPERAYNRLKLIANHRIEYGPVNDVIDLIADDEHKLLADEDLMMVFEMFEVAMFKSPELTKHVYQTSHRNVWYCLILHEADELCSVTTVEYRDRLRL